MIDNLLKREKSEVLECVDIAWNNIALELQQ